MILSCIGAHIEREYVSDGFSAESKRSQAFGKDGEA